MTIVRISTDEAYPVHELRRDPFTDCALNELCDVPEETLERWERVLAEYEAVQEEMGDIVNSASRAYFARIRQKGRDDDSPMVQGKTL